MSDADPVTRILAALPSVRQTASGWQAHCPAHEDARASLSIAVADGGKVLLRCHAGCATAAVLTALGLTMRDLFPPTLYALTHKTRHPPVPPSDPEVVYDYRDETGGLLFQVVRFPGKRFRQRRPVGAGWEWSINGTRRVLYRLPDLTGHAAVLIPEGERDVETLRTHGFTATTNPHGAGKWRDDYAAQLKAAGCQRVAVLPDHDAPGDVHARTVARSCHAAGLFVKIVPLADVPPKGDVSDYLRTHTRDDLTAAIRDAPPFDPHLRAAAPCPITLTSIAQLLAEPDGQIEWLVADRIPAGALVLLVAPPKVGKSTLARALTYAVATGTPCLGWRTHFGACWYFALEEKRDEVRRAFRRLGATGSEPIRVFVGQAPADMLPHLHALARDERPALIVVDTLQRLIKTKDLNDYAAVTTAFEPLLALSRETGASLLLLHHASTHAARVGLDAVLGSTALSGSVDNVLIMARTEQHRVLSSVQRLGPDLDPVVVALDETTGRLTLAGSQAAVVAAALQDAILTVLDEQPEPVTEPIILRQVEGRRWDCSRALRELLRQGRVRREGRGKKGDPYLYRAQNADSRVVDHAKGGSENRESELSGDTQGDRLDFGDSHSRPYKNSTGVSIFKRTGSAYVPSSEVIPTTTYPEILTPTPGETDALDPTETPETPIQPASDSDSHDREDRDDRAWPSSTETDEVWTRADALYRRGWK